MQKPLGTVGLLLILLFGLMACGEEEDTIRIGIIPGAPWCVLGGDIYWDFIKMGVDSAIHELENAATSEKFSLVYASPARASDFNSRRTIFYQMIEEYKVDVIAVDPFGDKALYPDVRAAVNQGIPVVFFQSKLEGMNINVSYVGSNQREIGKMAARHLLALLNSDPNIVDGQIAMLRFKEDNQITLDREAGFIESINQYRDSLEQKLHKGKKVHLLSTNRFAGVNPISASETASNILRRFPQINALFTSCGPITETMLITVRNQPIAKRKKFVGCDFNPAIENALRRGELEAVVITDPIEIGYKAVKTAYEAYKNMAVEERSSPDYYSTIRLINASTLRNPDAQLTPLLGRPSSCY